MAFEDIWRSIQARLNEGVIIPNWTRDKGYVGEPFKIVRIKEDVVEVEPPGAKNIQKIPRQDFQKVYEIWDDYCRGKIRRSEIGGLTRFSKYIISILHWIENQLDDYSKEFSEENFWKKLANYALKAGKGAIEKSLILYYTLQEPDVPQWAKAVIMGSLGYFIFPLDQIPDPIPVIGFTDDLSVLMVAFITVGLHITPEAKRKAKEKMKEWFDEE